MKHAYLILAHHSFDVLERLVFALDDCRNDIFILFDAKARNIPSLNTQHAKLFIIDERIDVRWGDISLLKAELILFKFSSEKFAYDYYHLLSGVDFPLKSQDMIHRFFEKNAGKEFIGFSSVKDSEIQIHRKIRYYHIFPKFFRDEAGVRQVGIRILRYVFLRVQMLLGWKRNKELMFKKGTNWVSVTDQFVRFLLQKASDFDRYYAYTFCPDEVFLQTLCWNSAFKSLVFDIEDEARGSQRFIPWKNNTLPYLSYHDRHAIEKSDLLFARKFSSDDIGIVDYLLKKTTGKMVYEQIPTVSVIIPFHNAENTLERCLNSLLEQDYNQIEPVLIDDGSVDKSLSIAEVFCQRWRNSGRGQALILSLPQNKGVSVARNTGLDHAKGDYIFQMDADDHIEANAIMSLMMRAMSSDAEIVGCNWYLTFDKTARKMKQPDFKSAWDAIQNMLSGNMRWNLWLFLVRRTLYEENKIRFLEANNIGEDLTVMIKLFVFAKKVNYVNLYLYHYHQSNKESLAKIYSYDQMRQVSANIEEVERTIMKSVYSSKVGDLFYFLKMNIKLPLLISSDTRLYYMWLVWFPESNYYAFRNKSLPLRTRLLQLSASYKQFWFLQLYNRLVTNVLYGLIYR